MTKDERAAFEKLTADLAELGVAVRTLEGKPRVVKADLSDVSMSLRALEADAAALKDVAAGSDFEKAARAALKGKPVKPVANKR